MRLNLVKRQAGLCMFLLHTASKTYPPSPWIDVRQRKGNCYNHSDWNHAGQIQRFRKLRKSGFSNKYYDFTLLNTQAKRARLAFTSFAGLTVKTVYE